MMRKIVKIWMGLVGLSEAHKIQSQGTMVDCDRRNQLSPNIRPDRIPMDHENRPASISLVHVVYLKTVKVEKSLGKRIILEVRPTLTYQSSSLLQIRNRSSSTTDLRLRI